MANGQLTDKSLIMELYLHKLCWGGWEGGGSLISWASPARLDFNQVVLVSLQPAVIYLVVAHCQNILS